MTNVMSFGDINHIYTRHAREGLPVPTQLLADYNAILDNALAVLSGTMESADPKGHRAINYAVHEASRMAIEEELEQA